MITSVKEKVEGKGYATLYKLQNKSGAYVEIYNLGAIIKSIFVPDKDGKLTDVALGFDSAKGYLDNTGNYGAIVGRCANRVRNASFKIDGVKYELTKNFHEIHQLHGGFEGFAKKFFASKIEGDSLSLTYFSVDGEEGYPGNLFVELKYTFTEENELLLDYTATCDADTIVNLTNHSYFNLSGHDSGDILDTVLKINSENYIKSDELLIPTGEVLSAVGNAFDFREFKAIGKDMQNDEVPNKGYDINYCLPETKEMRIVAEAYSPVTKIKMTTSTNQRGLQLFTSNGDLERIGKGGAIYKKHAGFCLEAQGWPNSSNIESFPSQVLRKGEKYEQHTSYKFSVEK